MFVVWFFTVQNCKTIAPAYLLLLAYVASICFQKQEQEGVVSGWIVASQQDYILVQDTWQCLPNKFAGILVVGMKVRRPTTRCGEGTDQQPFYGNTTIGKGDNALKKH